MSVTLSDEVTLIWKFAFSCVTTTLLLFESTSCHGHTPEAISFVSSKRVFQPWVEKKRGPVHNIAPINYAFGYRQEHNKSNMRMRVLLFWAINWRYFSIVFSWGFGEWWMCILVVSGEPLLIILRIIFHNHGFSGSIGITGSTKGVIFICSRTDLFILSINTIPT